MWCLCERRGKPKSNVHDLDAYIYCLCWAPVSIVSGLQFELRFVESFTVICAPIKNCSGGNKWIYLNWSVVAASSIYRLPFNFHVTFSSAWKQKWKYYKAACIQIRDTKSSRGFVIESPAQMTRLHNILGVITFHIFSILFLRCWHQTVQHFFNWKLNKDGFGLFRDSLGRSRLQVAVPKGLHKGGAIQRHGSVSLGAKLVEKNSTENSSGLPDVFLLFQATKEYPKSSMTSMGTFGYIWAIVRFPMVFRGFPVVLYNSVRGNSTYDSREPFFAMEAAIRSTMTRAGEQDDSGKAAWTQNFTPYQLGMQTLTSLVSPWNIWNSSQGNSSPSFELRTTDVLFSHWFEAMWAHLSLPNQFPARAFVYHCLRTSGTRSISSRSFNHRQTIRFDAILPYLAIQKCFSHVSSISPCRPTLLLSKAFVR